MRPVGVGLLFALITKMNCGYAAGSLAYKKFSVAVLMRCQKTPTCSIMALIAAVDG